MAADENERVGPTLAGCRSIKTGKQLELINTQNYSRDISRLHHLK